MPKFPRNRAGPLNLLLHQPMGMRSNVRDGSMTRDALRILTKAGALSIRSDSRGNKDPYSEGVSHLLTPIKIRKGCPLSLGDRLNPKRSFIGNPSRNIKGAVYKYSRKTSKNRISHYLIPV